MYQDAHNHLHDPRLNRLDRNTVVRSLRNSGLSKMVVNGTHPEDWGPVADLANHHPDIIFPKFGVHPWKVTSLPEDWDTLLVEYLDQFPGRVGIGEIGLDRWKDASTIERQHEVFLRQWQIAGQRGLPVTIHCLRAWGQLLELLRAHPLTSTRFLIHSVGASPETISELSSLGAYFSVSGYFAGQGRSKYHKALDAIPLDRLLIETDAPDMLPPDEWSAFPLTDEDGNPVCHPGNIFKTYEFVAARKRIPLDELTDRVTPNLKRFLGLQEL